jgi:transcriptional regulator with XRE-family HTH domain
MKIVFSQYLKAKRNQAGLTQEQLALSIGKTGMYISNIEKGKNNSPPKQSDLFTLATKLNLDESEHIIFMEAAAADRSTLPKEMIDYIYKCPSLKNLIRIGLDHDIKNIRWDEIEKKLLET